MKHAPEWKWSEQIDAFDPALVHDKSLESGDAQELLEVATDALRAHIGAMCEGLLIVDKEARIVWINERYPHRLGIFNVTGAIGNPVENVLPNSLMRTVVETGRPIMLDIMEIGAEGFVVVRLPLHDSHRNIIGAIGITLLDDALALTPLARRYNRLRQGYSDLQRKLVHMRGAQYTLGNIVGNSPACVQLKLQARRAARSCAVVLIQGEAGTGKEWLAQAIHKASDRAVKPFVAVNIAAIPESLLESEFFGHAAGAFTGANHNGRDGKFKIADGGTLFLDEIGAMSASVQAKLLHVLQRGEYEVPWSKQRRMVDVRIVAATGCDLQIEMAEGRFLPDLYYRLNVVNLYVPPLRDRPSDLPALCEHLLEVLALKLRLPSRDMTPEALNRLAQHTWPGNIRELSHVLERALLMSDAETVTERDVDAMLPPSTATSNMAVAPSTSRLSDILRTAERVAIAEALLSCGGNRSRAAIQLGISRTSLYEKVALHGLG